MAPGVEFGDLNWLAIGIAIVVNIALGFLWYSPKLPTGKIWMRETKMDPNHKPTAKQMTVAMILMLVGSFLMLFVFMHTFVAYRDAYQLDQAGYKLTIVDGVIGALMTWLGFFVPVLWSGIAWEGKSWSLFFVQSLYYLLTLLIAGVLYTGMLPA
jgi:hypothetical protein